MHERFNAIGLLIQNDETSVGGAQSILTIIDEKNKIIQSLKKQILNQKIQLSYYLHKTLDDASIAEFKKYVSSFYQYSCINNILHVC